MQPNNTTPNPSPAAQPAGNSRPAPSPPNTTPTIVQDTSLSTPDLNPFRPPAARFLKARILAYVIGLTVIIIVGAGYLTYRATVHPAPQTANTLTSGSQTTPNSTHLSQDDIKRFTILSNWLATSMDSSYYDTNAYPTLTQVKDVKWRQQYAQGWDDDAGKLSPLILSTARYTLLPEGCEANIATCTSFIFTTYPPNQLPFVCAQQPQYNNHLSCVSKHP